MAYCQELRLEIEQIEEELRELENCVECLDFNTRLPPYQNNADDVILVQQVFYKIYFWDFNFLALVNGLIK